MNDNRICIAKISAAHGIKGLVKLQVFAENLDLLNAPLFIHEIGNETLTLSLKNATNKFWIAKVDGIEDRNDAENLRGTKLYIDRSILPEPNEDEFYMSDLIGLDIVEDDKVIGKIVAVENFGASDLIEIQPEDKTSSFYLPFTDENIIEVKDKAIIVQIPEGLRD